MDGEYRLQREVHQILRVLNPVNKIVEPIKRNPVPEEALVLEHPDVISRSSNGAFIVSPLPARREAKRAYARLASVDIDNVEMKQKMSLKANTRVKRELKNRLFRHLKESRNNLLHAKCGAQDPYHNAAEEFQSLKLKEQQRQKTKAELAPSEGPQKKLPKLGELLANGPATPGTILNSTVTNLKSSVDGSSFDGKLKKARSSFFVTEVEQRDVGSKDAQASKLLDGSTAPNPDGHTILPPISGGPLPLATSYSFALPNTSFKSNTSFFLPTKSSIRRRPPTGGSSSSKEDEEVDSAMQAREVQRALFMQFKDVVAAQVLAPDWAPKKEDDEVAANQPRENGSPEKKPEGETSAVTHAGFMLNLSDNYDSLLKRSLSRLDRKMVECRFKYWKKYVALDLHGGNLPFYATPTSILHHVERVITRDERITTRQEEYEKEIKFFHQLRTYIESNFQHPLVIEMLRVAESFLRPDRPSPKAEQFFAGVLPMLRAEDCLINEVVSASIHIGKVFSVSKNDVIEALRRHARSYVVSHHLELVQFIKKCNDEHVPPVVLDSATNSAESTTE